MKQVKHPPHQEARADKPPQGTKSKETKAKLQSESDSSRVSPATRSTPKYRPLHDDPQGLQRQQCHRKGRHRYTTKMDIRFHNFLRIALWQALPRFHPHNPHQRWYSRTTHHTTINTNPQAESHEKEQQG